jgi:hypothetical protein
MARSRRASCFCLPQARQVSDGQSSPAATGNRSLSVAYNVFEFQRTEREGEHPHMLATDWEPVELSFVAVPFDPGAQVRARNTEQGGHPCTIRGAAAPNTENTMPDPVIAPAAEPAPATPPDVDPAPALAPAPEQRAAQPATLTAKVIRERCGRAAELGDGFALELIERNETTPLSEGEFERAISDKLIAARATPHIDVRAGKSLTESDGYRSAIQTAVVLRADPSVKFGAAEVDAAREFRGMTLMELARDYLQRTGISTANMGRLELAGAALGLRYGAMTTSDFANALSNAAAKRVRDAYAAAPETFGPIVSTGTLPDFKDTPLITVMIEEPAGMTRRLTLTRALGGVMIAAGAAVFVEDYMPTKAAMPPAAIARGLANGMRFQTEGFNPTSIRSSTCRTRHYSNVPAVRSKVLIPVFRYVTGVDTLMPAALSFQVGLETSYTAALTGIAPRQPYLFNGLPYAQYDPATWDPALGYIESDWLVAPISGTDPFGLWTTVQAPAAAASVIPYQQAGSNYMQRYGGAVSSGNSHIAGLGGASDVALSATSITGFTTNQTGDNAVFTPAMMLIEYADGVQVISVEGDSHVNGHTTEGGTGSRTSGDSQGSIRSNKGWISRGIAGTSGGMGLNEGFSSSVGGDRLEYYTDPVKWKYRRQLLVRSNPQRLINELSYNDVLTAASPPNRAASTAYTQNQVILAGGAQRAYLVTTAGTSSAGADPTSTTTGVDIADGTAVLRYLGPATTASSRIAWTVIGRKIAVNALNKAALPGAAITDTLLLPNATSNDGFVANQTPNSVGWGDATSRRGLVNAYMQQAHIRALMQNDKIIDPNPAVEQAPDTSIWITDGSTTNLLTVEGGHLNSAGAAAAAPRVGIGLAA